MKAKTTTEPVMMDVKLSLKRMRNKKNMLAGNIAAVSKKFVAFVASVTGISRQLINIAVNVCQSVG